ncbi:hypothetical protein M1L60_44945 [Actinoplanes sp. TRM 88003]|uniref:Pyridoxine 5'-phosphate oxidase dimerisation C-terminal domain-containing protein n=1 Tax=Paractinoplanes aksuensis TaxID=2939490 RepID=A0ABT1E3N3_9ACTN|nr:pyridoxine 5'-phosphate oxidase C-terminal domain-containing protein [Actinoplanes aksuensis]MCO8277745.1 hypothetical protein [Actinoplanes aksuensis]
MRDYLRALPVFAGNLGSEPAHLSAADFRARPAGSRAEASPGRQSQDLPDRRILDVALEEALARVRDQDLHETRERTDAVVPRWTLYNLDADEVEFWQGDRERKHTRLRYTRTASGWARTLLWP